MKRESVQAMVGHQANGQRAENDFYETPCSATRALFGSEKFPGGFWECACGAGAICKVADELGIPFTASDLINRGYGEGGMDFVGGGLTGGISQADLLRFQRPHIITNPPFNLSLEFTERALELATGKVAIFNKLSFMAGKKRYERIFSQGRLRRVYVFPTRPPFRSGTTGKEMSGLMEFAWFVFDGERNGAEPELRWILP